MENGNTATQVSPEDDMSVVRSVFERAANAITEASQLKKDMQDLRSQFDSLKREQDYLRTRNQELDTLLSDVRRQRDEAESKVSTLTSEKADLDRRLSLVSEDNAANDRIIADLSSRLEAKTKEAHEHFDAWVNSDNMAKAAHDKLAEIEHFASQAFNLSKPAPEPVAPPQPMTAVAEPPQAEDPSRTYYDPATGTYR